MKYDSKSNHKSAVWFFIEQNGYFANQYDWKWIVTCTGTEANIAIMKQHVLQITRAILVIIGRVLGRTSYW